MALLSFTAVASASAREKPVLLMFHPGGYVFGDAGIMDRAAEQARVDGFRPRSVEYTLLDPAQALRDAEAAALEAGSPGTAVYAYGESAGGGLAARLAQLGYVRAAACLSPLVNLRMYAEALFPNEEKQHEVFGSAAVQRRLSPAFHRSDVPILATVGETEGGLLERQVFGWARRDPDVEPRMVPGGHIGSGAYHQVLGGAMGWLRRKAG